MAAICAVDPTKRTAQKRTAASPGERSRGSIKSWLYAKGLTGSWELGKITASNGGEFGLLPIKLVTPDNHWLAPSFVSLTPLRTASIVPRYCSFGARGPNRRDVIDSLEDASR